MSKYTDERAHPRRRVGAVILVVLESPYAGTGETEEERAHNTEINLRYMRVCLHDCFERGEAPIASHGLYTQPGVLDDTKPEERELGIAAGFAWRACAKKTAVYTDLGITEGMAAGIEDAKAKGRPVEMRSLGENLRVAIAMAHAGTEEWGRPFKRPLATEIAKREFERAQKAEEIVPIGFRVRINTAPNQAPINGREGVIFAHRRMGGEMNYAVRLDLKETEDYAREFWFLRRSFEVL